MLRSSGTKSTSDTIYSGQRRCKVVQACFLATECTLFAFLFFFLDVWVLTSIPKKKTSHISTVFWKNTTHQNKSVTITIHPPTLNVRSLPCPFSNLSFPCNYMHAACWCPAGRTLPLAYETKTYLWSSSETNPKADFYQTSGLLPSGI